MSTVTSHSEKMPAELLQGLKSQAKMIYIDAAYSGKGHLNAAEKWQRRSTWLGVPATAASSFLAAGAAVSALLDGVPWVTAILAGGSAVLTGLKTFLQPEEKANSHGAKGNQYLAIRNDARAFLEIDVRAGLPKDQLVNSIKDLRRRYNDLLQADPQLSEPDAFEKARRGIEAGETSYKDDPLWQELADL